MLDKGTIEELHGLMPLIEQEESLRVVIFESADPDFFFAHYEHSRARQSPGEVGPTGYHHGPTRPAARKRTRRQHRQGERSRTGRWKRFILACDLRLASKERAIFGQPEVGVGIIPGGGAVEWLPRLVGRSRAIEIIISADDFDATTAEVYGMINRAIKDAEIDAYVQAFALRVASFDKQALTARLRVSSTELEFRKATNSLEAIVPSFSQ